MVSVYVLMHVGSHVQLESSKPCGSSRTFLAHGVSGIFCVVVI